MSGQPVILVVEDNEANQLLARAVLEREGFDVDVAGTPDEAFERLRARVPDLILMDIQLPGQDGLSLTRRLKADVATSSIPVVALTAHAMRGDRDESYRAGCIGYIAKPIDTRTLGGQVREFLTPAAFSEGGLDEAATA
jgi:CheY-like chemotaxis protein